MTELDFGLSIALAVLIAYLLWSFNRRLNAEIARAEARHRDWQGKGFVTSAVSPRIELLRRDYASAARTRRPFACAHMEKVARARHAVRELPFFEMRGVTSASATDWSDEKPANGPASA
jgi:hypothetical protein